MNPTTDTTWTNATRDAYWNDISYENEHDKVSVPMLTIEGWYDRNLNTGDEIAPGAHCATRKP